MNVLAFDTCFNACSVAAGVGLTAPAPRVAVRRELREKGHAEALLPMVRDVMAEIELPFARLDRIAVTRGPGSFTGMRVGIAAARALAMSLRVPLVATSSLVVMALRARRGFISLKSGEVLAVAVDARRGEVYVQIFAERGRLHELTPPLVRDVGNAARLLAGRRAVIVGSGAAAVAEEAARLGLDARAECDRLEADAGALLEVAPHLEELREPLAPLYLRAADAKPQTANTLRRVT